LNTATYKMISGEMRRWHGLSKPDEYTEYALADAKEKLVILGNRFPAALVGIQDKIRLPPHSTVEITANSVVLQNGVCRVTIELLEHFLSMTSFDPRDRPQKMVMLPNGKPRFQNVSIGVRVTTETSSARSGARPSKISVMEQTTYRWSEGEVWQHLRKCPKTFYGVPSVSRRH